MAVIGFIMFLRSFGVVLGGLLPLLFAGTLAAAPAVVPVYEGQAESGLLQTVRRAFAEELRGDREAAFPGQRLFRDKQIWKVALAGDQALVLVRASESKQQPETSRILAYNFHVRTGAKQRIETTDELCLLELAGQARFDSSPVPDLVVTYQDCAECDSDLLLGSFRFDPQAQQWQMRMWNVASEGIAIGRADDEADEPIRFSFLHTWQDLDGDGLAEIAVEFPAMGTETKARYEQGLLIYKAAPAPHFREVTDPRERERIHGVLCGTRRTYPLCGGARGPISQRYPLASPSALLALAPE